MTATRHELRHSAQCAQMGRRLGKVGAVIETTTTPEAGPLPAPRRAVEPQPLAKPMLTTDQVARRLHVDPSTVRRWIEGGILTGVKAGKRWRVEPHELDAFIAANTRRSRPLTEGSTR